MEEYELQVQEELEINRYNYKNHTFHLQGFSSTTLNREIAEEFALKGTWGGRIPVIFEITIKIHDGKYRGFQMNKPQYTAYPHENEFLILDGADYIVEEVQLENVPDDLRKKYNVPENIKKYYIIRMTQVNDWDVDEEDIDEYFVKLIEDSI